MSEDVKTPEPVATKKPVSDIERETAELNLELAKLNLDEKKASLEDLRARNQDRAIRQMQLQQDRQAQGRTFAQQRATDESRWAQCTHKKGGSASARDMHVLHVGGNGAQYAVLKHQMITGDIWVRCLRCGKTWAPPLKMNFFFDEKGNRVPEVDITGKKGKFDSVKFEAAKIDYMRAVQFETNNSMSGSVQCRFSKTIDVPKASGGVEKMVVDATDQVRGDLANTNLR